MQKVTPALILTGPALAYLALSTYFESKRNNLCAEVIVKSCIFRTGVVLFGRKFFFGKKYNFSARSGNCFDG